MVFRRSNRALKSNILVQPKAVWGSKFRTTRDRVKDDVRGLKEGGSEFPFGFPTMKTKSFRS